MANFHVSEPMLRLVNTSDAPLLFSPPAGTLLISGKERVRISAGDFFDIPFSVYPIVATAGAADAFTALYYYDVAFSDTAAFRYITVMNTTKCYKIKCGDDTARSERIVAAVSKHFPGITDALLDLIKDAGEHLL